MSSAGKIVKHLLAKNGPMTNQAFSAYVPTFQKKFMSKRHLKQKILGSLEGEGVLFKKAKHDPSGKITWEWQFKNEADIETYKNMSL
jgi:hypothetical protein